MSTETEPKACGKGDAPSSDIGPSPKASDRTDPTRGTGSIGTVRSGD